MPIPEGPKPDLLCAASHQPDFKQLQASSFWSALPPSLWFWVNNLCLLYLKEAEANPPPHSLNLQTEQSLYQKPPLLPGGRKVVITHQMTALHWLPLQCSCLTLQGSNSLLAYILVPRAGYNHVSKDNCLLLRHSHPCLWSVSDAIWYHLQRPS